MVKHGPCRHCGVTSTPLWRNGPPEKPVLCNACGSRWRTKGNLTNYTPLHTRLEHDDYEDYKVSSFHVHKPKEAKVLKRKKNHSNGMVGLVPDIYHDSLSYRKFADDELSYRSRSSSGSGASISESFGPFSSTVGSDLTGPEQSVAWETTVLSKKRTCISRPKPSPMEIFTQELYMMYQEQQSYCSESPEEALIYESNSSVEIGNGSVLIKHPSEIVQEEESEASSISAEIKTRNEVPPVTPFVHTEAKGAADKGEKVFGQRKMNQTQSYRNKAENVQEILCLLGKHDSPLCDVNLNDIVNLEEFAAQFTTQEQRQLLRYLPKSDIENYPIRLKSLFTDPNFRESFLSLQQLLSEGVFDLSFPNVEPELCWNLRRLALSNPIKSNWVEQYNLLKKPKNCSLESSPTRPNAEELRILNEPEHGENDFQRR